MDDCNVCELQDHKRASKLMTTREALMWSSSLAKAAVNSMDYLAYHGLGEPSQVDFADVLECLGTPQMPL